MPQQGRYRTGDQALVRQMNLSVIMHHLRENGSVSRAALAEMSGLNKTTVSSLVQELIESALRRGVRPEFRRRRASGDPAAAEPLRRLHRGRRSRCRCPVGDPDQLRRGDHLASSRSHRARNGPASDPGSTAGPFVGSHTRLPVLRTGRCWESPWASPGWSTRKRARCFSHPIWDGWKYRCGLCCGSDSAAPVYVDNEANLAALGEHYFGVAQGYENVLFLSLGVGLGGGIVQEGKLNRGASGFSRRVRPHDHRSRGFAVQLRQPRLLGNAGEHCGGFPQFAAGQIARGARRDGDESPHYERLRESPDRSC